MDDTRSCFPEPAALDAIVTRLVEEGGVPAWMTGTLRVIASGIEILPLVEDEDHYVIECVYPH